MNPRYRVFIDESGGAGVNLKDPNDQYLTLTGVIIHLEEYREHIIPAFSQLKEDFFGDQSQNPTILHRDEIIKKQGPFKVFFDTTIRDAFNLRLLQLFTDLPYKVISVSIDKNKQFQKYGSFSYEPYFYCFTVLLERYYYFLSDNNSIGDVMIESRNTKLDKELSESFTHTFEFGLHYVELEEWHERISSASLKISTKKSNDIGLQMADLLAHPCRYDTLVEYKIIAKQQAPFGRKLCEILRNGKYVSRRKVIKGCGLKLL